MKSARASETRIRHPPEKELVFWFCISAEKPRPKRMAPARDGADLASISSRPAPARGWRGVGGSGSG